MSPSSLNRLILAAAMLHSLAVVAAVAADRTALNCTTAVYVDPTVCISTAGQYDVSCTGFSEWYVWIVGCASNGTNSSNSVVSIRLLNSPTQVHVTDNVSLTPNTTNATLAGCSVDITYLSDTVVPLASSNVTYPPVYVSSKSFMGNISVILLATLYLERAFIAILGNNSGGIDSVALRCDQGSSIVCRRAANNSYSICSPSLGTSLIVLGPGCPQIDALSVHLNGTNVTGSMWLKTDSTSTSTFSCVLIDNSAPPSVTSTPNHNSVVMQNLQGLMVLSNVLAVRTKVSENLTAIEGYDIGHGRVIVINCTMIVDPFAIGDVIFSFDNVVAVQIILINVECTGFFLNALSPRNTGDAGTVSFDEPSLKIHIVNSSMRSIGRFMLFSIPNPFNGTVVTRNVLSLNAENSVFILQGIGSELLQFYSFSAFSSIPPVLITVSILFSKCTVNATYNNVLLLYTSSPNQAQPPPILHNSSIVFEDYVVYQTWETYVDYFGTVFPPVPLIQADLNDTTIVFARCNIFVQQVSSPTTPAVALLLSINNAMTTSSLHFINSYIAVTALTATPLRPFPISIIAMSSSNITLANTTLTNLLALVQLLNTSSPLNSNAIVDGGCSNSWCAPVDNRPCAPVALRYVLTTAPPPDVVVAVCSHSWSGSADYSVTSLVTQYTQPPSLSLSYSTSSTEPRATASVASSTTIAKDTVSVFLSTTASESIEASSSVVASVSQSTSKETNTYSSTKSISTYNWSATESKLVPFIAVNDLLPPAAVQALVVAAAAPLASVALSTSVAGVLQRNFVALRFSSCASRDTSELNAVAAEEPQRGQLMPVSENPTRLTFGDSAGAMYRGAAVGNMILFVVACTLIVPVGLVYSRCKKLDADSAPRTLAASLGKLRLPGRAFVVLAVLLQPTVTAAAGLLMMSPLLAGDVVLSVVTIGVLVFLVGAPAWVVFRGCRVLVTAVDIPFRGGVVDYIAGRRVAWIPRSGLPLTSSGSGWLLDRSIAGAECFALQYNSFIGRVGSSAWRELYFLFGCLWSVVTGVVGALDPNDLASCYVAQITLVAVPALSLITLLVVRPFVSPFDRNLDTALDLLSLAVAILSCVNEGQAAQSVSYAEVAISTGVSLVRILLQFEIKKATSNSKRGGPLDPKINPRNPFGKQRSNHHRQSMVEKQYMQHDIISSDSSTRQHQICAVIIHSAELGNAGHPHRSTLPLDPSMVIAAGEDMCRHALEYAAHRTSNTFVSAFIPVAVQRRHLLRLILMATQMSAHASRSEPPV